MESAKGKSTSDLEKLLVEKRDALRKFRFGVSGSKVRNIREGRNTRKEIAQILTELRERGIKK
jgi:large subunit ribosomal protein L29